MSSTLDINVCFITACYNAERWIEQALNSVVAQDYNHKKLSMVIIDDASTDNSVEKVVSMMNVEKSTTYDDRVETTGNIGGIRATLIELYQNGHQGRARNYGVRHAWSYADTFAILDADDWKYPNYTRRHVDELTKGYVVENNKKVGTLIGVIYADYDCYNEETGVTTREYKRAYSYEELHKSCEVSSPALIDKEVFKQCGLYYEDEYNLEDYSLWLRASNRFMMVHIPESLMGYRIHSENSTNIKNQQLMQSGFQTMINNYNNWRSNPVGYSP